MFLSTVSRISFAAFGPYFSAHSLSQSASDFVLRSYYPSVTPPSQQTQRSKNRTYMPPRLQLRRLNSILMKPLPFLKRNLSIPLVALVIPIQHVRLILDTDALAVGLDDAGRVVEHVIRVDDADLNALDGAARAVGVAVPAVRVVRADDAGGGDICEEAAELVVTGFGREKRVEARQVVEGRDRAAEVGRDASVGIADQEGEVEG